jgi:type IV secretory pathway VirB10-like protein
VATAGPVPEETPQPRLRWWVVPTAVVLVVSVIGGIMLLPTLVTKIPLPTLFAGGEHEPPAPLAKLPKDFERDLGTYGPRANAEPESPPPQPPVAQVVERTTRTGLQPGPTTQPVQGDAMQAAILASLQDVSQKLGRLGEHTTSAAPAEQAVATTTTTPPENKDPRRRKWKYLAEADQSEQPHVSETQKQALAEKAQAQEIIKPAKWSIPVQPLKTIYRSMRMTGKLLDSINSDIPASTIRIELSDDLTDKFRYDTVILDKGSVIIAQQVGKAEFGQKRIPLKIEQIELITGEVIKVDGGVGDTDGAAGVPGKVNAHIGGLLLATGINAVMNIGLGYASGTPGRGQYYQDPSQRAAQDMGQSVARDVNEYTRQVLKRPPTIEVDAQKKDKHGTPLPVYVTVSLVDNIQLNRAPALAR